MSEKNVVLDYDDPFNMLIGIPKITMDRIWKTDMPGEVIALYTFYCYTAKWQKTNSIKCTTGYASNGLKWSPEKIRKAKLELKNLGLIEDSTEKTESGKIKSWYIKIKFLTKNHPQGFPQCGKNHSVVNPDTNALSIISLNALSTGKESDTKVSQAGPVDPAEVNEQNGGERDFSLSFDYPEEKVDPFFEWVKSLSIKARDRSAAEKSSQPFSIPRNDKAKYLNLIKIYLMELSSGTFLSRHKFEDNFIKNLDVSNLSILDKLKGCTIDAILLQVEAVVNNYLTARNTPEEYDFIARDRKIDLGAFFYEYNEKNNVLGVSHFLKYAAMDMTPNSDTHVPEMMLSKIYDKNLQKMYKSMYKQYETFSEKEMVRLIKSALAMCRWWKKNESRLFDVYRGKLRILFPKGKEMETFLEYHIGHFISEKGFQHPISLFPGKPRWKEFCDWFYDSHGIDFEIETEENKEKKESTVSLEEIERRMEQE